ncbi:MAG: hypothetical protein SGJ07_05370 [Rhodospirillaceae bacterium]|nr:hypothetical protein [Rhodospirillaceae bacterium]
MRAIISKRYHRRAFRSKGSGDHLNFVIAGLDPAIHRAAAPNVVIEAESSRSVDCRVKPGNDGL